MLLRLPAPRALRARIHDAANEADHALACYEHALDHYKEPTTGIDHHLDCMKVWLRVFFAHVIRVGG